MVNVYESPRFVNENRVYGLKDIVLELCIPFYSLYNGYLWDSAIAEENGLSHQQIFSSNLSDYLSLEFFKTCVLSAGIASYYLLR